MRGLDRECDCGDLLAAGHRLVMFDDLSRGHREAVAARAELVVGDLADSAKLESIFQSQTIDAVMHFATFIEAGLRRAPLGDRLGVDVHGALDGRVPQ